MWLDFIYHIVLQKSINWFSIVVGGHGVRGGNRSHIPMDIHHVICLITMKVKMKVTQLCLTLCDPMDYTVCGILQARIVGWVAYPFSRGSFRARNQIRVSCIAGRCFTVSLLLEWVAYPFSKEACWPRNLTKISCIVGRFFTNWAISLVYLYCKYLSFALLTPAHIL